MKRFVFGLVIGAAMSAGFSGTLRDVADATNHAASSLTVSVSNGFQSIEDAGAAIADITTAGG